MRQVALGDCGGHVGDRADLDREVRRQPVDVVDQVPPRAGCARHACLSTQPAFDADLARDGRDLVGKRRQRIDHAVDRPGELLDLPFGFEHQFAPEISVGHVRDDAGDAADLIGQVVRHEVDVVGEILPRPGRALHDRLAAELAFRADLARDARDFRRERIELIEHRIDDVLGLQKLAADIDGDLLRQVSPGDGRRDLRYVAQLHGQVAGERVDVVGQILPDAADAPDCRLAAELTVGTDFARDASHFRCERRQLIDHRVDRVLELEDLALHVDGDLAREIAARDSRRHLRDVTDLTRQVRRHEVHIVGKVLPRAGDAFDNCLTAKLAVGADLARHPRHLGCERSDLSDHRVHHVRHPQELAGQRPALDLQRHRLRQIALRYGADHSRHFRRRLRHVVHQRVQRVDRLRPAAAGAGERRALLHVARLADDVADALQLASELLVLFDDVVHRVVDLPCDAGPIDGHARGEIAAFVARQDLKELLRVNVFDGRGDGGH